MLSDSLKREIQAKIIELRRGHFEAVDDSPAGAGYTPEQTAAMFAEGKDPAVVGALDGKRISSFAEYRREKAARSGATFEKVRYDNTPKLPQEHRPGEPGSRDREAPSPRIRPVWPAGSTTPSPINWGTISDAQAARLGAYEGPDKVRSYTDWKKRFGKSSNPEEAA